MISSLLLEAALRSVLLALAVWAGLRIFSVRNVLAQKAAWGLVLVSALGMPIPTASVRALERAACKRQSRYPG